MKAANIAELMAQPDIDGALVGGASLDPDEFARIVQSADQPRSLATATRWNVRSAMAMTRSAAPQPA